jgi:hypothetical protein
MVVKGNLWGSPKIFGQNHWRKNGGYGRKEGWKDG